MSTTEGTIKCVFVGNKSYLKTTYVINTITVGGVFAWCLCCAERW